MLVFRLALPIVERGLVVILHNSVRACFVSFFCLRFWLFIGFFLVRRSWNSLDICLFVPRNMIFFLLFAWLCFVRVGMLGDVASLDLVSITASRPSYSLRPGAFHCKIAKLIRFEIHPEGNLYCWECLRKAEWLIHGWGPQRSYTQLGNGCKFYTTCWGRKQEARKVGHRLYQRRHQDESRPTYAKRGAWLCFGHPIALCARAIRTILNHAPIGQDFISQEPIARPCSESDL